MGPITYSLCKTQYIGIVMFISGMCAFPNLIEPTEISLQEPGIVLSKDFNAPVDENYLLTLNFIFPSVEERIKDSLVGDGTQSRYCNVETSYENIPLNERKGLGLPIPLKVIVRKQPEGTLIMEHTFPTLCKGLK